MYSPGDEKLRESVFIFLYACAVILLVGGQVDRPGPYGPETISVVESFDPLTNQRKILAPLPEPLSRHRMVVLGKG